MTSQQWAEGRGVARCPDVPGEFQPTATIIWTTEVHFRTVHDVVRAILKDVPPGGAR